MNEDIGPTPRPWRMFIEDDGEVTLDGPLTKEGGVGSEPIATMTNGALRNKANAELILRLVNDVAPGHYMVGFWPAMDRTHGDQWYVAKAPSDPYSSASEPLTEEDVRFLVNAANRYASEQE